MFKVFRKVNPGRVHPGPTNVWKMTKKTTKTSRGDQYRAIMESYGVKDYKVLEFVFDGPGGPELFHYELMHPLRPVYHLFNCYDNHAVVVIPIDPENEQMCIQLAESCGGEKTTPNLK